MSIASIELEPRFFSSNETRFVSHEGCSANLFRFPSGVCAIRLSNALGELTLLPFQGQQIWSFRMRGRDLGMRSIVAQPLPTRNFLETFGGFMQHCGATAMGAPGPQDTHPLHGELPNAPYQRAYLKVGEDEYGAFIGLSGEYEHAVAFGAHYLAQPEVRLYAGSSLLKIQMQIANLGGQSMPLMYLFHVNFRPVDQARLVYSAPCDPAHMRVRTALPGHMKVQPTYAQFVQRLAQHPEDHLILKPGLAFDPEVVLYIDYRTDAQGWAYALQVHPDGSADGVRHKPAQLPYGIRWICRTPDHEAIGFEAGAAGVEGRFAEEAEGRLRWLGAGEQFSCEWEVGALDPAQASQWIAFADEIAKGVDHS